MGATGTKNARAYRSWRPTRPAGQAHERALRWAWALFLVFGVPFLLMAVLTTLAMARIYVEPFRALWQPFPPEALKPLLGVATFAATLGYLAYRAGRNRGFRFGHVAGMAAARNVAEGWKPAPAPGPSEPAMPLVVVSPAPAGPAEAAREAPPVAPPPA